jgi:VanZ family protein
VSRPVSRLLRWLPAIAWAGFIFVLSDQPGLRVSDDAAIDGPLRALGHVAVFAVLAFLLVLALGGVTGSDPRPAPGRRALIAFALATLYGVVDEVHQSFVPDRTGRADDVLQDAAGAALGVAVALVLERRRRRRRPGTGLGRPLRSGRG